MLTEVYEDKFKEECGIFGVYAPGEHVAHLTYCGLFALQHRGQESAGMAVADGEVIDVQKDLGLVRHVFRNGLPQLPGHIAIGHVRYSTTGSNLAVNTQPLCVHHAGGQIALAHNGNLVNVQSLRNELQARGSVFQTSIDSEVIVNLMARSDQARVEDALWESMQRIQGAYSLVVMTENQLLGARDPHGFRPLCLGKLPDGWVLASESCALDIAGAELVRDIEPGEMVVIDANGPRFRRMPVSAQRKALCVFEFIYFARPDSIIDGYSVQRARFDMGRSLARSSQIDADVVIGVPDSGTSAALGYAAESGIPYNEGLIKNRYIGRTFIQPDQQSRDTSVRLKLNPVRHVVEGKRVVMVDDSIVRGTTSGKIVHMLREAGAKEIHMCVSSPPIVHSCHYGIDTSVRKELIASQKTVAEINTFIGADSLHYLSLDDLKQSIGLDCGRLCNACFNGDYPVNVDLERTPGKYVFEKVRGHA